DPIRRLCRVSQSDAQSRRRRRNQRRRIAAQAARRRTNHAGARRWRAGGDPHREKQGCRGLGRGQIGMARWGMVRRKPVKWACGAPIDKKTLENRGFLAVFPFTSQNSSRMIEIELSPALSRCQAQNLFDGERGAWRLGENQKERYGSYKNDPDATGSLDGGKVRSQQQGRERDVGALGQHGDR